MSEFDTVVILDAGAQFLKLIDRSIRSLGVNSDVVAFESDYKVSDFRHKYKAVIVSGGPLSVTECSRESVEKFRDLIENCGIPILGICYGFHYICEALQPGSVRKLVQGGEDGQKWIEQVDGVQSRLFEGTPRRQRVLLTHRDSLVDDIAGIRTIARSDVCIAAIEDESRHLYGIQFHPETQLTDCGIKIFENFLKGIAGCRQTFTLAKREESCINEIREMFKKSKASAACLLSRGYSIAGEGIVVFGESKQLFLGGIDSTVCCRLLQRALGEKAVYAIHVDTGFMRSLESENSCIYDLFSDEFKNHLLVLNAFDRFTNARSGFPGAETEMLCETVDPETKRHIIGDTFVQITNENLCKLAEGDWGDKIVLVQGTLRPDLIESASPTVSSMATTIKTHHNDTPSVRELRDKGRILEPLKDFHKNEIRAMAKDLGLSDAVVHRHPFPGPGLAIRIICSDGIEREHELKSNREKLRSMFSSSSPSINNGNAAHIRSYLDLFEPYLLPIKSVGVQGDSRSYGYVVALQYRKPNIISDLGEIWDGVELIVQSITSAMPDINRVVVVLSPTNFKQSPPRLIPTLLSKPIIEILRNCDSAVNECFDHGS